MHSNGCIGSLRVSGAASAEYVVVTFVVIVTLFVPIPGMSESLVGLVLNALRGFQANTTYLMSLP
ncbi:MAG: hypothetical protein V3U76_13600 [Granulosicoccus sp.]